MLHPTYTATTRSRRLHRLSALACALALPMAASATTTTFDTPGEHNWPVPAGITSITVTATGGGGGGGENAAGGAGGVVTTQLTVTPGTSLALFVGGGGAGGDTDINGPTGSGGGASTVFIEGIPQLVAGGGGGASYSHPGGAGCGDDGGGSGAGTDGGGGKGGSKGGSTPTGGAGGAAGLGDTAGLNEGSAGGTGAGGPGGANGLASPGAGGLGIGAGTGGNGGFYEDGTEWGGGGGGGGYGGGGGGGTGSGSDGGGGGGGYFGGSCAPASNGGQAVYGADSNPTLTLASAPSKRSQARTNAAPGLTTKAVPAASNGGAGSLTITYALPVSAGLGGTISGLTAAGLVLESGGSPVQSVSPAANATSFAFADPVAGDYAVTVKTQPAGLQCTVASGTGTISGDVNNVAVSCVATPPAGGAKATPVPSLGALGVLMLSGLLGWLGMRRRS